MLAGKDPFVIFLHVPKAGGLTLQRILRRRYGPGLLRRLSRRLSRSQAEGGYEDLKQSLSKIPATDRLFMGHVCYGVHRYLPTPSTYITFLREPISRLISLYYYSRDNASAYYHERARDVSMREFLLEAPLMELDNGMTRFLAGDPEDIFINRTPIGSCGEALLNEAKANVERDFALVGITERFDESILLLKERLGWSSAHYIKRNVRRASASEPTQVDEALREALRERNALDVRLYDYAVERHEALIAAAGLAFASQLEAFQVSNARFSRFFLPFYNQYDALKSVLTGERARPRG